MQHNKEFIEAQARIFKALGHPSRLLMVDALRDGEKCVCDLQALVGDDMSTISKHLAVLRDAGVVTRRKQGVNIYYSLALCCLDQFLACTGQLLEKRINGMDQACYAQYLRWHFYTCEKPEWLGCSNHLLFLARPGK